MISDRKESHPIQIAEYSLAQGVSHEPAFNLWENHVLNKREEIISALKDKASRVIKKKLSLVFDYHKQ